MHNYMVAKNNRTAWKILLPFFIYFLIFSGIPTIAALILGFVRWVGLEGVPQFVGLKNFKTFFTDPLYLRALFNSFFIGTILMIVNVTIGLIGAYLMNMRIRGKTIFQTLWILPSVTAYIATSQIFLLFLDPSSGVFNSVRISLGMEPVAWGYSTFWMMFWIIAYGAWRGIGSAMILWLAGLQAIDKSLYEQAEIDGASKTRVLWNITLPMLRPVSVFVLITQFREAIQIFEPVLFISKGGPFGNTQVLVFRIYTDFFGDMNFGMAGAGSMVMTLIVIVFSLFTVKWYVNKGGSNA